MAETEKAAEGQVWERIAFTLDGRSGQILKFQGLEPSGRARDLSRAEMLELAKRTGGPRVEMLLEGVFEAGIAALLDGEDEEEKPENPEEIGVRRALLRGLIERSTAARAFERETLRKAVLQSLIEDSAGSNEPETAAQKPPKSDRPAS